jgi:hypothetical protein
VPLGIPRPARAYSPIEALVFLAWLEVTAMEPPRAHDDYAAAGADPHLPQRAGRHAAHPEHPSLARLLPLPTDSTGGYSPAIVALMYDEFDAFAHLLLDGIAATFWGFFG